MGKMNKAAKKWVKALRSGKYKKTVGKLADEKGFCCLGVACELAIKDKIITSYDPEMGGLDRKLTVVKNWLGLKTATGKFDTLSSNDDLAQVNDDPTSKKGFKYIADLIEKKQDSLFV